VVHAQSPGSIEGYWQEAGRAGRDGKPSECVLLFSGSDRIIWQRLAGQSGLQRFALLEKWAMQPGCRQAKIQAHFGETDVACGRCDACLAPEATLDAANTAISEANRKRKVRDDRKSAEESVRLDPAAEDTIVAFVAVM